VRARSPALALVVCVMTVSAAAGHAVLQRAEPPVSESKLKRAPEEVKLYFSERLEPAYSVLSNALRTWPSSIRPDRGTAR